MSVSINKLEDSAAGRALQLISAVNLNKFVDFTSGLVREVFKTLIGSTLEQLEAYADLVSKVSGTAADFEAKALGDVNAAAVDYLNKVVLPSFGTGAIPTLAWSGTAVTGGGPDVSFDAAKQQDLEALFAGINAAVAALPISPLVPVSPPLAVNDLATFESLLESTGPQILTMKTTNLHAFTVAKLKHDVKATYDKIVTLLKIGMSKIVVQDGEIDTTLTFHVTSADTDEANASQTQTNVATSSSNWAVSGGLSGGHSVSGTIYGFLVSKRFGFGISGGGGSSSSNTSTQVATVNEKSTAVTNLSFDITGGLKLRFRSDFFPSIDAATLSALQ
jgi:hypothetical protein